MTNQTSFPGSDPEHFPLSESVSGSTIDDDHSTVSTGLGVSSQFGDNLPSVSLWENVATSVQSSRNSIASMESGAKSTHTSSASLRFASHSAAPASALSTSTRPGIDKSAYAAHYAMTGEVHPDEIAAAKAAHLKKRQQSRQVTPS
eukprot:TRINITY_DN56121_c0_g1_i1.p1 TRINITY_DN56121_c0_g1~~TRINITY_DN56121_c0_g1_i1.p1  ORF type:complete len:146 (+),score=1.87 TRINITY_DN56121_c0_g1_i1:103-540(+)